MPQRDKIFDRDWRINHLYKIQTKKAQLVTFQRNHVQQILAKGRAAARAAKKPIRELILKSRQHGITTDACVESLDTALFSTNVNVAIIANKRENVQRIFRKIKLAYDKIPELYQLADGRLWRKPEANTNNVNELSFGEHGSKIYVDIKVRGDTIHRLHVSEAAFVPESVERIGSTMEAVPKQGEIILETTANGAAGYFYDLWCDAEEGENEFKPIFFGWNQDPDNRLEVPKKFVLTKEEQAIKAKHDLDDQQICWHRQKKKRLKGIFLQEHPLEPEEAFLFSGRPVFDREKLALLPVGDPERTLMGGRLKVWHLPVVGDHYIMGIDVAEGKSVESPETTEGEGGSDWSVIEVINWRTGDQMAEWRGKIPYTKLPDVIRKIGSWFNWAYAVPEKNNHGHYVVPELLRIYPKNLVYLRRRDEDYRGKKKGREYGWTTTATSKPVMINDFVKEIDDGDICIYSRQLQKECFRYIIEDDGKTNAQNGYHDDCVMAFALALQGRKVWNPLGVTVEAGTREKLGF